MQKLLNGILVDMTAGEEQEVLDRRAEAIAERPTKKLNKIKFIRLQKLEATDFWVLSGNMTSAQSNWRQSLRNIPQDNTTEEEYDLILARDENGQLTNEIWSKP